MTCHSQTNRRCRRTGAVQTCIVAVALFWTIPLQSFAQPPCRVAFEQPEFAFTAGCLMVRDGRMLTVKQRRSGKLGVPAGFARPGESAQCAAHRETWEETGINVVVHGMIARLDTGLALYRCETDPETASAATAGEPQVPESGRGEVSAVSWTDPTATRPSDWRFPRDYPLMLKLVSDQPDEITQ